MIGYPLFRTTTTLAQRVEHAMMLHLQMLVFIPFVFMSQRQFQRHQILIVMFVIRMVIQIIAHVLQIR